MDNKNLIVFYSRTGTTRRVAEAVRNELGCESMEIQVERYPRGLRGFLRAGWDTFGKKQVPIRLSQQAQAAIPSYDCIIIGTPVWGSKISSPVRTYLSRHLPSSKQVAFLFTHASPSLRDRRILDEMESLCGKKPVAVLNVSVAECRRGSHFEKIRQFVRTVQGKIETRAA